MQALFRAEIIQFHWKSEYRLLWRSANRLGFDGDNGDNGETWNRFAEFFSLWIDAEWLIHHFVERSIRS